MACSSNTRWVRCHWQSGRQTTMAMGEEPTWLRDGDNSPLTTNWRSTSSEWESRTVMNSFGQQVQQHWKTWLPTRYSEIENPETFFAQAGEQIAEQVLELSGEMEAAQSGDLMRMSYLDRVGRLNAIEKSARESVLSEWLLEPETSPDENEVESSMSEAEMPFMDEMGMPVDQTHPLWAMSAEDHPSTLAEFKAARREWIEQELAKMKSAHQA